MGREPQGENRAARTGGEAETRAALTSLRRFGEIIPGRLRPRRACVRFTSPSYHATT